MDERLPLIPDPATVPAGAKLLVRMRDGRVELILPWTQPGQTCWLDGHNMAPLKPGEVADAMLLTPDKPFGSVHWKQLDDEQRQMLYWGALMALAERASFRREVADAWVRTAFDRDDARGRPNLINRLRKDALDDARKLLVERIMDDVDVQDVVKRLDVAGIIREEIRQRRTNLSDAIFNLMRDRIDVVIRTEVERLFEERMGDAFAYMRKAMGLVLNNTIGRLGTKTEACAPGEPVR